MAKKPETSKELDSALERIMSPDFPAGKLPKATLDDVRKDALAMTASHNAQPTPGPWRINWDEHDAPYQPMVIKAENRKICEIWQDDAPVHDFNREQKANARLIASAPALAEENARLREALAPFAAYGKILRGQQVRLDKVVLELWDTKITVGDLTVAFQALASCAALAQEEPGDAAD